MASPSRHRFVLIAITIASLVFLFLESKSLSPLMPSFSSEPIFNEATAAGGSSTSRSINKTASALRTSNSTQRYSIDARNNSGSDIQTYSNSINKLRILGERHSGTTFFTYLLGKCFPDIEVEDRLLNGKHWLQPSPDYVVEAFQNYSKDQGKSGNFMQSIGMTGRDSWTIAANSPNPKSVFQDTLVLALFRDPYQWMEAMRIAPHHWPNHLILQPKATPNMKKQEYHKTKDADGNVRRRLLLEKSNTNTTTRKGLLQENNQIMMKGTTERGRNVGPHSVHKSFFNHGKLDWDEFVKQPMRLVDEETNQKDRLCQKGYKFGTISPCRRTISYIPPSLKKIPGSFLKNLPFSVNDVVYELRPNGQPYEHPLQLRAAKIENFLSVVDEWELGGFGVLQYEDLQGPGLETAIQRISVALNMEAVCGNLPIKSKKMYSLPVQFRDWVTEHADWAQEARIGYSPDV
jgi:hypothetical protein